MQEISLEKAKKFADENCNECGGSGWTWQGIGHDDRVKVYCYCANENMIQHEAEGREE